MGNNDSKQQYDLSASSSNPSTSQDSEQKKSKKEAGAAAEVKPASAPTVEEKKDVDKVLCRYDDMKDGEMKEVTVADQKVLLARNDGTYYAVSPKCTHYGASLAKGVLCNGRLRCPWHGACFNITNGDIEDFPGLDSLESYAVEVEDGNVTVHTDTVALASKKRVKKMITRDQECTLLYLIVGGGGAAMECAETLRQGGYKGKILIVTKENDAPYDRTKLSKALTSSGADLALRNQEFFSTYNIDIMTGMEAFKLIPEMKHVIFRGREWTDYLVEFDQAMIATGGEPRRFNMPSADRFPDYVRYLRTPADANTIANAGKDKHVVVVGTSFIGMEIAAYFADKAQSVTVIGRSGTPFANTLGEKIGSIIKEMFDSKGVKFRLNSGVKDFQGEDCRLTHVVLNDDEVLPADLCVAGLGVKPTTDYLAESGLNLDSKGNIIVNKYMKTNCEAVYAAGDITSFPLSLNDGELTNIGHWQMALAQGRCAAQNMLFQEEEFHSVPYFWTMMFGKSIRFCGYSNGHDEIIFHGDNRKFIAFYVKNDAVKAVASLSWDPMVSLAAELMHSSIDIPASAIREDPEGLIKLKPC